MHKTVIEFAPAVLPIMEGPSSNGRADATNEGSAQRRLQVLAQHMIPAGSSTNASRPGLQRNDTAGAVGTSSFASSSLSPSAAKQEPYSSATGAPSSYARVHGPVSAAPAVWRSIHTVQKEDLQDVKYEKAEGEGIAKITINRPEKRNAFRPRTVQELSWCFADARDDPRVGAIILTGAGPLAFCSGGDQDVRGKGGYVGADGIPRLNVLDLQVQMRRLPKPIIAMVAGYAVGGGHILHMMSDLTIAADNAVFGQTGPKVGSFDAGYGSTQMVRLVGQKKAREMWFLARMYDAQEAMNMGLINTVVPLAELEKETVKWCREILRNSPTALRVLKAAMNAAEDGQAGIQELGGNATMLFYQSEEGNEGREAYLEKRPPNFEKFNRLP